jgi:transcription initiation factor TFIID subunit 10
MSASETQGFLQKLDEWEPTIPDEVIEFYLARTGFHCPDKRVKRMIALAAERFLSEVAREAYQSCRMRMPNYVAKSSRIPEGDTAATPKEHGLALTMEDLAQALAHFGVDLKKPEYWSDS